MLDVTAGWHGWRNFFVSPVGLNERLMCNRFTVSAMIRCQKPGSYRARFYEFWRTRADLIAAFMHLISDASSNGLFKNPTAP
jgi:hypothetical protein